MKIRLLDIKTIEEYEELIFSGAGGADGALVVSLDHYGDVIVGNGFNSIGLVVGIYIHDESGSAWILVRPYVGGLVEVTLEYNPNTIRGLFNNAKFRYE